MRLHLQLTLAGRLKSALSETQSLDNIPTPVLSDLRAPPYDKRAPPYDKEETQTLDDKPSELPVFCLNCNLSFSRRA